MVEKSGRRPTSEPQQVILLGASNLTRGISTVVGSAESLLGTPLQILVASGHGRSYGSVSSVLGRQLPGIRQCGLWQAATTGNHRSPPYALVTDLGNDLFYGASVELLTSWVDEILQQLVKLESRTVVTLLPIDTADTISPWRFRTMRRMMFPSCELDLGELKLRIGEVNQRLIELCFAYRCTAVEQRANWYGFDPIHIRFSRWSTAWTQILRPWATSEKNIFPASPSLRRWIYLRSRKPLERVWLGRHQVTFQPAARFSNSTTVAFY